MCSCLVLESSPMGSWSACQQPCLSLPACLPDWLSGPGGGFSLLPSSPALHLPSVPTALFPVPAPCVSRAVHLPVLVMDYGPNPWVQLSKSNGLPRAASGCPLTNVLLRLRGQPLRRCSPLLEVFLSTFLIEPPRPLAAHQVSGSKLQCHEDSRHGQTVTGQFSAAFLCGQSLC